MAKVLGVSYLIADEVRRLTAEDEKKLKGSYKGFCNRKDCSNPRAVWYNHSTTKYYCEDCAKKINDANREEARDIFGHDLCTRSQG